MKKNIYVLLSVLIMMSCSNGDDSTNSGNLNIEDDLTGFFNLYPLVENPTFVDVSDVSILDGELVGVIVINSNLVVFPYSYFQQVEVINVNYLNRKFVVSYCPITKSCIAFRREGVFRASGYLYKDNLVAWDEQSGTIWSQMLMRGLRGDQKNVNLDVMPVVQVSWGLIKAYFPTAKVLSSALVSSSKVKPPEEPDHNSGTVELPSAGELTYGMVEHNTVEMYRYSDFIVEKMKKGISTNNEYLVYGNPNYKIINAFKVDDFSNYSELNETAFPYVFENIGGVRYDIFGRGTNGVNLISNPKGYVAAWWAWDNFYESIIFNE